MSQRESIPINPYVGDLQAEFADFCRQLERVFRSGDELASEAQFLREKACAYLDRPSSSQLKFMLVCNLLLDLALHGWSVKTFRGKISLNPPNVEYESPAGLKERTRQKHLIERDAQLSEPAVQDFIKSMERRRLTSRGWHSIYSVIRDGEELAAALRHAQTYGDPEERARQLAGIIDPYLQFVSPDAVCTETGLRLNDIWRYFRHTWVNIYRSVPGRSVMVLVRDRARPYHPVIGIAALGNSVVQQSIRDRWIGWDSESAVARLTASGDRRAVRSLLTHHSHLLKNIYTADLRREGLLSPKDLKTAPEEVIARLRAESIRAIKLHRKSPEAAAHKSGVARTNQNWSTMARTNLYRSKRCKQLAALLDIQHVLRSADLLSQSKSKLLETLQKPDVKHALRRLVRFGKAERVGVNMMDITVCGAIAPYNAILGGKLVCLLLCSPEVAKAYADRYANHVSLIASGMNGESVKKKPRLVLLCTTSLYGNGSSQYNRVKLPAASVGGKKERVLRYEELGTSEGFGSFHLGKETVRIADALLGRSKKGRKVNSIFGEGVNPLMRKMREALSFVNLPSDLLLKHGNKRIVYGIALAENFREVLLGLETKPKYILPKTSPRQRTSMIGAYWTRRWLAKRIEDPAILEQVAHHSLAYPILHGAQVKLPGDRAPEMLKIMAASTIS
jgi:Druantia protein DruA